MTLDDILDPELERLLGTAAPALREWGAARRLGWLLDRRLTEGKSGAVVAFVFERDRLAGATKLLMKMDSYPDVALNLGEFARHRDALDEAPEVFARRHLAELAPAGHDLVRVGDGRWIMFQRVAAPPPDEGDETAELHDLDVLSKVLASVSAGRPVPTTGTSTEEPVLCAPDVFVRFCGHLTRTVLDDWAGQPDVEPMTAARYLREHLLQRMADGLPLNTIAQRLEHDWLVVGDNREVLPNPFTLMADDGPGAALSVKALLGRAHGDLHTGNVLVPITAFTETAPFRLIDLAKYSSRAPLARDPAGLLLTIVVRVLRFLDESQREAVGNLLLEQEENSRDAPPWLVELVAGLRGECERWARRRVGLSLAADWRPQWRLSLIGFALILLGRRSTRTADRLWLLQFAGRATRAALSPARLPRRTAVTEVLPELLVTSAPGGSRDGDESWVEWLCEYWPRLSRKVSDQGGRGRLDELGEAARRGEDRCDEFLALVRQVDGKAFATRDGEHADVPVDEVFTCPLPEHRCARVVRPHPADDRPRCALHRGAMRHEFW
ncbi:hypothetical protein [Amycolatopsis sp. NPDC051061]|uniref:hypothetical protein n=1 Tax=Amycolatopsis sp. NPDC051061 TaxID=3155042 RepID=UPI003413AAB0